MQSTLPPPCKNGIFLNPCGPSQCSVSSEYTSSNCCVISLPLCSALAWHCALVAHLGQAGRIFPVADHHLQIEALPRVGLSTAGATAAAVVAAQFHHATRAWHGGAAPAPAGLSHPSAAAAGRGASQVGLLRAVQGPAGLSQEQAVRKTGRQGKSSGACCTLRCPAGGHVSAARA